MKTKREKKYFGIHQPYNGTCSNESFPDVKFAIGPPIDDGFYYDFDTEHRFTPEDLEKIEEEMKRIAKEGHELVRYTMPRNEALEYFKEQEEIYKVDLIENLPEDEVISFYKLGGNS